MTTEDRRVPAARARREGTRSPSEEALLHLLTSRSVRRPDEGSKGGCLDQIDVAKTASGNPPEGDEPRS
jgi:hypothetical protein